MTGLLLTLLTLGFLTLIGLVCLILARGIRSDTWGHDRQNVWKDREIPEPEQTGDKH